MEDLKLLIVEDEEDLAEIYKLAFEGHGFEVQLAIDGEAAIVENSSFSPDIILLDIMLPRKNGYDVLIEIRREPPPDMPFIIMNSNLNEEDEMKKALNDGANDFFKKEEYEPFELAKMVKNIFLNKNN